jgi:hypothetical protein
MSLTISFSAETAATARVGLFRDRGVQPPGFGLPSIRHEEKQAMVLLKILDALKFSPANVRRSRRVQQLFHYKHTEFTDTRNAEFLINRFSLGPRPGTEGVPSRMETRP